MKKYIGFILLIGIVGIGTWLYLHHNSNQQKNKSHSEVFNKERFLNELNTAKKFIQQNSQDNQQICFLIDMKIPSAKNRFFVCNLQENKIIEQGLVAHGTGSETEIEGELNFSNIKNSLCTSLGMYEISNSYIGQFGKAYKLIGLDTSNSNALLRNIVLHKYECVPFSEQNKAICNSYGCPMVNEKFFNKLEKIIDGAHQPILMKIYY